MLFKSILDQSYILTLVSSFLKAQGLILVIENSNEQFIQLQGSYNKVSWQGYDRLDYV